MNQETNVQVKSNAQLPANTFEQDAGKGLGKLTQEDLALPKKSLDSYRLK